VINKLGKNTLQLQFRTIDEAKAVREARVTWEEAYPGLAMHKPKYGPVIHGVPTGAIDLDDLKHDNTIKEWETDNSSRNIKIVKASPLRRRGFREEDKKIQVLRESIITSQKRKHYTYRN
jgi:hypothetical protein